MRAVLLSAALAIAAAASVPASAQPVPAPVAAPDPARLAVARRLMDRVMPPAQRSTMVDAMVAPMMANMETALAESPQFKAMFADNPDAMRAIRDLIREQQAQVLQDVRRELPALLDALGRAYARRFSVQELEALDAFFTTPVGAAYLREAPTIMLDPDVSAWQRGMMGRMLETMPARVGALINRLSTIEPEKKP